MTKEKNKATKTVYATILLVLTEHAVWVGLGLRVFLAWFLPWLLDDEAWIPGVAYTDIDYHVFTDAADHIRAGGSPYDRHTYRYTPFLAALLAVFPSNAVGRYLFCAADALCGWMILRYRRIKRQEDQQRDDHTDQHWKSLLTNPRVQDSLWWLYNPLAINICTRGSSESLAVLFPVLLTVTVATSGPKSWQKACLAGICHGVAVHSKLYPIIYSLSFMTFFCHIDRTPDDVQTKSSTFHQVKQFCISWAKRLLTPAPLVFFVAFSITFVVLTYFAVLSYGNIALEEGLLYHFSRVDHRHNYSIFWYWIYLARAQSHAMGPGVMDLSILGRLLLLPQALLLVYTSVTIAPTNLGMALFVQTFLFVAQNKVITAQYFTWYLCLLPLCSDSFQWTRRLALSLGSLLLSIGFWLGSAYCLEMQGWPVHRVVWIASMSYFAANVALMGALLDSFAKKRAGMRIRDGKLD